MAPGAQNGGGSLWTLWFQFVSDLFRWIGVLGRELKQSRGRYLVLAVPLIWLALFFLVPFLLVAKLSVASALPGARPPTVDQGPAAALHCAGARRGRALLVISY